MHEGGGVDNGNPGGPKSKRHPKNDAGDIIERGIVALTATLIVLSLVSITGLGSTIADDVHVWMMTYKSKRF